MKKIYFDGCSSTWGSELKNPNNSRFSKLVCDHFGADEYNIARRGCSDKRLVRNLLETDLSPYDCVIVQFTCKNRTECWSEKMNTWVTFRNQIQRSIFNFRPKQREPMSKEEKEFVLYYWKHFYSDKLGIMNELIYYNAIRNILKDKKHLIIGIAGWGQTVQAPVDINFTEYTTASRGHPDENAHKVFAEKIIKSLESDT